MNWEMNNLFRWTWCSTSSSMPPFTAYGCVARDMYNTILHLNRVFAGYDDLQNIVDAVGGSNSLMRHVSHDIMSMCPLTKVGEPVKWSVDFKSHAIVEQILEKWADTQDGRVRELMAYLSSVAGKPCVRWLFKSLAHHRIEATDDARA